MDKATLHTLLLWQQRRASCAFMANLCREQGDLDSAIFWQNAAANAHLCYITNEQHSAMRKEQA